jgi:hypothetical protein
MRLKKTPSCKNENWSTDETKLKAKSKSKSMEIEKKKSDPPHIETKKNDSPFFLEIDPYFNTPEPRPKKRATFDKTKQPVKYYEREFIPENILFYYTQSPRSFDSLEGEKFTAIRGKRQEVIEEAPMASQQVPNLDEKLSDCAEFTNVTALKNKSTLTTTYSVTTTKTTLTTPTPKSKSLEERPDLGETGTTSNDVPDTGVESKEVADTSICSNKGLMPGEDAKTNLWSQNAVVPVEENTGSNRMPTNVGFSFSLALNRP